MWHNWGYIAVQIIMVALLVMSLVVRQQQTRAPLLQYIALWLGVFLLAIFAYIYKDTLLNTKESMLGALLPGYTVNTEEGAILVYQNTNGHFYINAEVSGIDIEFMVDTGASVTVLSRNDATRLGLINQNLVFNKTMQTAGGVVMAAEVVLPLLRIGDIEFEDVKVAISSQDDLLISLMGISLLQRFSSYQFKQNQLYLYHSK